MPESEWPDRAAESIDVWDTNAAFWDDFMGDDSNRFHRELVRPAAERLLDVKRGDHVLDIACGNGNFSRRLVELGATVTAIDGSSPMIDAARERSERLGVTDIDARVLDVTDEAALSTLSNHTFDSAVSNMGLMDMAVIDPLFKTLARVLRPGGRFVFCITHPCFQTPGAGRAFEETEEEGVVVTRAYMKISSYIEPEYFKGIGIKGQPQPQLYFHRPLHLLLDSGFRAGFVVDGIEEPTFAPLQDASRPGS